MQQSQSIAAESAMQCNREHHHRQKPHSIYSPHRLLLFLFPFTTLSPPFAPSSFSFTPTFCHYSTTLLHLFAFTFVRVLKIIPAHGRQNQCLGWSGCGDCKAASLMADFAIGGTILDGCFYPRSLLFHNSFATISLYLRPFLHTNNDTKKAEPNSDSA